MLVKRVTKGCSMVKIFTHFLLDRVQHLKMSRGYCTLQRQITYWCKYITQMICLSTAFVNNLSMFCYWCSVIYTYGNQSQQPKSTNFLILFSNVASLNAQPSSDWVESVFITVFHSKSCITSNHISLSLAFLWYYILNQFYFIFTGKLMNIQICGFICKIIDRALAQEAPTLNSKCKLCSQKLK